MDSQSGDFKIIVEVIKKNYRIDDVFSWYRLNLGQGTFNYNIKTNKGDFFVKQYSSHADLKKEESAIELSSLAGTYKIPVSLCIPNIHNELIDSSSSYPFSLWSWVEGTVLDNNASFTQYRIVGATLGKMHNHFSKHPLSSYPSYKAEKWLSIRKDSVTNEIDNLIRIIGKKIKNGNGELFDEQSIFSLNERKIQLDELYNLITQLPKLTTQVIHGDYTFVNMLFEDEHLKAILDFRNPEPFFIAYELGRIAFHPSVIFNRSDWIDIAEVIVRSYKANNPNLLSDDYIYCGHVALIQLLKSLYGVKQHYFNPGLIQSDLDDFWVLRHFSVRKLLSNIDNIETMLRSI